jgi:hypothetical protein
VAVDRGRVGYWPREPRPEDDNPAVARVAAPELGGQRDFEAGCGDRQLVLALSAQQDAGMHRHRALAVGDALREAQPANNTQARRAASYAIA